MTVSRSSALAMVVVLAACSGSVGSVPTSAPLTPIVMARGSVQSLFRVTTITKAQMSKGTYGEVVDTIGGVPACDVALYSVTYATIGVHGEPANASAAFFVPLPPCKKPFRLVGYAHGTNVTKKQLITQPDSISAEWTPPDQDPIVIASIFAAHGYAVAATDYLGLGLSTYPFHPYLHADSEASAVIDSLRAIRNAAKQLHVSLSPEVFITGHSQGGQSAVATQRAIEAQDRGEFDLRGDAPSSGPYALTETFEDSLRKQSQDAPILAAYILTGYEKIYNNIYSQPTQVFKPPYAAGIDTLLPVETFAQEAELEGKTLPLQLDALLQPAFVQNFLTDADSGARRDSADNDLLKGWTPKAPVWLCGGDKDPEVEFKNARLAYAYFKARHVSVRLTDVGPFIPASVPVADYHVVVALFCLPLARVLFFDTLK
jgi:pimeloyl-ACP methyl ester carboxylesterase